MSVWPAATDAIKALEAIMLEKFETEPFHNLALLFGERLQVDLPGGTCSDKTLSFLSAAKRAGFDVGLHSGFIGGQEIHRLARVHLEGRVFFADVGNGWPALKMYPADREVSFTSFGMRFRTELDGDRLRVFHMRRGKESLQLEIDLDGRPESEIRADIKRRFSSGIVYPFSHDLRFALVVDERFLFLRGDRLEIYSDLTFGEIEDIQAEDLPAVMNRHFGFGIKWNSQGWQASRKCP